jgi:hypothetical protein
VRAALLAGAVVALLSGCGSRPASVAADPAKPIPTPIGVGPRFVPPAHSANLGGARRGLVCRRDTATGDTAHLELFAEGRVVLVPQGIGIAPPIRHGVQRIVAGHCRYSVATFDRTGVIDFTRSGLTLADLFAVWGEPLSPSQLVSFRARAGQEVHAFVGGKRWRGNVRDVPLTHHAEIVIELNGFIPPHQTYLFPG